MRDGWNVLGRSPGVVLAEIVWRWTFGVAFWVLLFLSFHAYFSTIQISRAEYQLMKSLEPYTWAAITVRVIAAFVSGMRAMGPILVPGLSLLWIATATAGRAVTVRELSADNSSTNWAALAALNTARLLITFASILAFFGAGAILSAFSDPRDHFALNFFLMTLVLLMLASIWSFLNWFLSVAAIFPSRDSAGIREAFSRTADLYHFGIGRVSVGFGLLRTALVIGVTFLSLVFAASLAQGHRRGPIAAIIVTTAIYFALSDLIYVWRLATYISMTEPEPEPPVVRQPEPPAPLLDTSAFDHSIPEPPDTQPPHPSAEPEPPNVEPLNADS